MLFKIILVAAVLVAVTQASQDAFSGETAPGVWSDRLDHLEACVAKDASPDSKLSAILEKCKSEKDKDAAIRFCVIKNTLRTDLGEVAKLLWCLFES